MTASARLAHLKKKQALQARIAAQRLHALSLLETLEHAGAPLMEGVQWVKHHRVLVSGCGLALFIWKPRLMAKWLHRGALGVLAAHRASHLVGWGKGLFVSAQKSAAKHD